MEKEFVVKSDDEIRLWSTLINLDHEVALAWIDEESVHQAVEES